MNRPVPIGSVRRIPVTHLDALLDRAAKEAARHDAELRARRRLEAGDWREELLAALRQPPPHTPLVSRIFTRTLAAVLRVVR